MDESFTHTMRCERCGEELGPGVFRCYERDSGNCPYVFAKDSLSGKLGIVALAALTVISCSVSCFLVLSTKNLVCNLLVLAVAALVYFYILYRMYPGATLYNPETGATWYGRAVLGIEIDRLVIPPHDTFPLDVPRPAEEYPASIAAMASKAEAGYVLEATLLDLAARGIISIRRARVFRSHFGGTPVPLKKTKYAGRAGTHVRVVRGEEYSVLPGPNMEGAAVQGALEMRIVQNVLPETRRSSAYSVDDLLVQVQGESARKLVTTLTGASTSSGKIHNRVIRKLVWAIYDIDKSNPGGWLVDLVRDDAAGRGIGHVKKTLLVVESFEPAPAHAMRLLEAGRRLQSAHDLVKERYPDFFRALHEEVGRGIASRTESSD